MNIKLVASDLDGTIIDKNNKICDDNFLAIKKIHEKNIIFTVCTGKSYSVSKAICKKLNADFGIFGNGAQIIDLKNSNELARTTLKYQDINFCINLAKQNNLHLHLYTEDAIVSEELKYMDLRNFVLKNENSNDLKFIIVNSIQDFLLKENPSVFSIVVTSENSLLKIKENISNNTNVTIDLINKKGEYKDFIIDKEYEYLYIVPPKVNKNEGLIFLSKYLKIPQNNIISIGDNVNDLEMIKYAGIGIAVSDAYDELKQIANYITRKSTSDGAFSEAINKYII